MLKITALIILLALPALAHADISDDDLAFAEAWIEANLEETPGQAYGGRTLTVDQGPFPVTGNVIGVGFCSPPDPTVEPNPNPTPPNNAWGCVNDVTASGARTQAGVTLTTSAAVLFLDFSTSRLEQPLCGECFSECSEIILRGGYGIATSAVMSANYEEVVGPGGRELVPIDGTQSVTLGGSTFTLADGCLETFLAIGGYLDDLEGLLIDALESEAFLPIPLPDSAAVEDSTWGRIKAIYSN